MEVGVVHSEAGEEPLGSSLCGQEEPPLPRGLCHAGDRQEQKSLLALPLSTPNLGMEGGGRPTPSEIANSGGGAVLHRAGPGLTGSRGPGGRCRPLRSQSYQQPLLWAGLCGAQGAHVSARPQTEHSRAGPGPPRPLRPAVWTPWGAQSQLRQPGDSPSPAGNTVCSFQRLPGCLMPPAWPSLKEGTSCGDGGGSSRAPFPSLIGFSPAACPPRDLCKSHCRIVL